MSDTLTLESEEVRDLTAEPEVLPPSTDVSKLADASANKPALWESERQQVAKFTATVSSILAPSDNPELQAKLARATRLEIKPLRVAVEKMRKQFNEDSQQKIKACNALAKTITDVCEDMEGKLLEVEQYAERAEAARVLKLTEERTAALAAVGALPPANVGSLTEEVYTAVLEDATELQKLKIERERKAEEARQAQIEAARQEHLRVEAENARLKAEAAETARLAKIEADRIAAERAEEQRKLKAEAAERDRLAKIEADKVAAERAEEQRKAQEAMDKANAEAAKARKEAQEAADKAKALLDEQERIRKAETAAKAKAEAEEAARLQAERDAAAKAAAAPDKDKLMAWLASFKALALPEMTTDAGKAAVETIRTSMRRAYPEIKTAVESL